MIEANEPVFNKDIKGFQIKIDEQTHSIKISQSADDTTLYFNSKNDISVAMNEIEIFRSFSGLVINRNKTEGLWIGKLKHSKDKEENIKLNSFQDYCSIWKLKVNTDKSKVMVFSRGKLPRNLNFSLNGEKLEIVNSLNYLGIELSRTGNLKRAKQSIAGKATVAFYEVLKMGRKHGLSVKIQLDLFDKMVKPILLYGCEVWGFSNNDIIEKVHLKFCVNKGLCVPNIRESTFI
jgi:hypothetical protein